MTNTDAASLLFIEPELPASEAPVIDDLTRLAAGAMAAAARVKNTATRGVHNCTGCFGASSDNCTWSVGGLHTHTLLVHYVAYHRDEVPESEIAKLRALSVIGQDPTAAQLMPSFW